MSPRHKRIIKSLEKEYDEPIYRIIEYFAKPENDRFKKGFGLRALSRLLGLNYRLIKRICKSKRIKIPYQVHPPTPLEDKCLNKWHIPLRKFLEYYYKYYTAEKLAIMLDTNEMNIYSLLCDYGLRGKKRNKKKYEDI